MDALARSIQTILDQIDEEGRLPEKLGEKNYEFITDFQSGSPGAIPLLTLAIQVFPHLRK